MRGRPNEKKGKGMYTYKAKDGQEYRLVESSVILRGGKEAKVYYFIGKDQKVKPFCKLADKFPEGYEITETRTKPLIRRSTR
jgi:hypothetical protein